MADLGGPSTPESGHSGGGGGGGAREQDRFLPIANIGRIMRKAIPENGKIAKEAKESVQECVSEFISFITSEASDKCQREKRKTINGDDLLWAMGTLGFEDYIEPLKLYMQLYREMEVQDLLINQKREMGRLMEIQGVRSMACRDGYIDSDRIQAFSSTLSDQTVSSYSFCGVRVCIFFFLFCFNYRALTFYLDEPVVVQIVAFWLWLSSQLIVLLPVYGRFQLYHRLWVSFHQNSS